ncbi:putative transporter YycB [bacterium YEK0313]|nr:putative transporter YycB [bacterium YEK0313]
MRIRLPPPSKRLLLLVVVLVGLNLRPFLAGIGPLAGEITAATGLDYRSIALFTLVPMLLMGLCAFAGPSLQRLAGVRPAVVGALVLLGFGSALRLLPLGGAALIGTAAMCGLGVAIVQAVFPGVVKEHFPGRVAFVMGLYSAALMGGGALGAQAAPLVAELSASWRIGLGWLAVPAALAAAAAAPALLRRPRTWLLMACFGLVNGGYSTVIAWLAPSYQALGWSAAASGGLIAAMAASQAVSALAMPLLAAGSRDRRPWMWLALALQVAAFAGLAFWPAAMPLGWAVLAGIGLGGSFALAMVVALDHLDDAAGAGALSALMQGGGFLIAAVPPWIVAVLHDLTGGFAAGWLLHLGCAALVGVLALRLSPRGYAAAMRMSSGGDPDGAVEAPVRPPA